jgi:hypothetical protein
MDWITLVVDGLWIAALAIMSSVSRQSFARILPSAKVPMQFGAGGAPIWRAPRLIAVGLTPIIACGVWLVLVTIGQTAPAGSSERTLMLGIRAFIAPVLCLIHLWHMRQALKVLQQEGQLGS